jgi:AraC-like DNA-binding protein
MPDDGVSVVDAVQVQTLRRLVYDCLERISVDGLDHAAGAQLLVAYAPRALRAWNEQDLAAPIAAMLDTPCAICGADHLGQLLERPSETESFECGGSANAAVAIVAAGVVVAIVIAHCRRRSDDAASLLPLLIRYVQAAVAARLADSDLVAARRISTDRCQIEKRLVARLRRVVAVRTVESAEHHGAQSAQVIDRVLRHIHANYQRPLTLDECAHVAALHPVYLSGLFSRTVGVPFKAYLTDLRLEKARQLLRDPVRRVSEIAFAVGYRDANRFRLAFKAASGLSPARWRETVKS